MLLTQNCFQSRHAFGIFILLGTFPQWLMNRMLLLILLASVFHCANTAEIAASSQTSAKLWPETESWVVVPVHSSIEEVKPLGDKSLQAKQPKVDSPSWTDWTDLSISPEAQEGFTFTPNMRQTLQRHLPLSQKALEGHFQNETAAYFHSNLPSLASRPLCISCSSR